jgi:hypothetical protein
MRISCAACGMGGACFCVGLALSFGAVVAADGEEFLLPSAPACFRGHIDFGPLDGGCNEDGQPHPRSVFLESVAATGSTTSIYAGWGSMSYSYSDLDHYQVEPPQTPSAEFRPLPIGPRPDRLGSLGISFIVPGFDWPPRDST